MAEIAALTVSIVGLATLFETCMQGFEYIQLGKTFGEDYSKCLLRLDISRLRLARWAETVGLTNPQRRHDYQHSLTSQEFDTAKALLDQIKYEFESIQRASEQYEKIERAKKRDPQDLEPADADIELDLPSRALRSSLRARILKRQEGISLGKKAKWALYEKKRFDRTLEDINSHVAMLIDLFPANIQDHRSLCHDDIKAIDDDQELRVLGSVFSEDNLLQEALETEVTARGHRFEDFSVNGDSSAHIGDINYGVAAMNHTVRRFAAHDKASLHAGNINVVSGFQLPQRLNTNGINDVNWQRVMTRLPSVQVHVK